MSEYVQSEILGDDSKVDRPIVTSFGTEQSCKVSYASFNVGLEIGKVLAGILSTMSGVQT